MARRFATLGLLCIACPACTSGQIGGEVIHSYPTDEAFAACEVVAEVPVAENDAALPFDLEATMEAMNGSRAVETFTWGEDLQTGVSITPEAERTTIEIEIEVVRDSAFSLERQALEADTGAETEGMAGAANQGAEPMCPELLAFQARVSVTSENHALADTFDVTFVAHSPYLVTAAFDVAPGGGNGDFDLEGGEGRASAARFDLAWADGRLSGSLWGSVVSDESATNFEIARFPSDGCLDGHDLPPESPFVTQAEAFVSGLDHFALDWPNGTSTELSLTPEFGTACLGAANPTTVVLPVACAAETTDGGIDGLWELSATLGYDDSGDLAWALVSRADFAVSAAGEFATDTGITGIAVDAESPATFAFQLSDELDDQPAEGTLTVLESRPAMCESVPEDPSSDGGETPGCSGDEMVELGRATLTGTD